jgi:Spy/CpxP family protein refolding chaperone
MKGIEMPFRKVLALSMVGACTAGLVIAQETKQPAKVVTVAQKEQAEKPEAKKPRLPNYFGKLNITDDQRGKIVDTLIDYNEQIDALEEQIQELRTKRDAEVRAVLTDRQRETLGELEAEAKKKRQEKSSSSKKAAEPAKESK